MSRPNVILITWHDVGDWLGCYGRRDVTSPCLDRLAQEGVVCDQAFSVAAQCSPSRAAMMTGLMPHATGVMGLTGHGFDMDRSVVTLPQRLRDAGYSTHLVGLQHECLDPAWEGYEDIRTERRDAESVSSETERLLKQLSQRQGQPFFLAVGMRDVHRPLGDDIDESLALTLKLPAHLPEHPQVRRDVAAFLACVERADRQTGRILDAVEANGLRDNTLVVFAADHGAPFPRAKHSLFDPGLKVALMLRMPGAILGGIHTDELVSNVDLTPTILDLVGLPAPTNLHGRSFKPALTGQPHEPRTEVFAESTWHEHYEPMRLIRTREHKYIRNFKPGRPMTVPAGSVHRYGPELIEKHFSAPLREEMLFQLDRDPLELDNCVDSFFHADVLDDLRRRLQTWMEGTDDPLLKGDVACPLPERLNVDLWEEGEEGWRLKRPGYWERYDP